MSVPDRRALIVRGGWPGHSPEESTDLFLPFLEESGFDVDVESSLEVYADAGYMAGVDLIVQSWTMGEILPDEMRGLRDAVTNGAGLAGWHGGIIDSFRMATDYLQMLGGQFAAHPGDLVEHSVEVLPEHTDHPLVAGLGPFHLNSEQYWVLADSLNEVLATTTIQPTADSPWRAPVVSPSIWTRQWGAGKIFVCAPGHQLSDLESSDLRTVIERGLLWASR
jgi:type 1 glutamine amidotransferase